MADGCIPDSHRVTGGGHYTPSVPREADGPATRLTLERVHLMVGLGIPHLRNVPAARDDTLAVRRKGDGDDSRVKSSKGLEGAPGHGVPHNRGLVFTAGDY